jgi:sporulation integral membrane protein YtvI
MPYISPIIAAFVISFVLEPLIKQLIKRIRIKRAFAGPAVIILVLALVFLLLWAITARLMREFSGLIVSLPDVLQGIYDNMLRLFDSASKFSDSLPFRIGIDIDIGAVITRLIDWALVQAQEVAQNFVKNAVSTAATLPGGLMFVITMMLATFFIIVDRDKHAAFFRRHFPQSWFDSFNAVKNSMFLALFGYVKAQLALMVIIFVILLAGFLVLGVSYSYLIAFIIALVDALPVLGSSMILIPWAVYMLLIGNYFLGVGLIALFLVCSGARRFIEPKLISSSIGANPLLTVTSMYVGLKAIGLSGMILGPIFYILMRAFVVGLMDGQTFKEYFFERGGEDGGNGDGDGAGGNATGGADDGVVGGDWEDGKKRRR